MTILNEEILHELGELVALERKRHQTTMAILTDVKKEIDTLVTNTKTMLSELAATGHVGHAAVLDDIQAAIKSAGEEIAAAGKDVQLPGAPAKPGT